MHSHSASSSFPITEKESLERIDTDDEGEEDDADDEYHAHESDDEDGAANDTEEAPTGGTMA